MTFVIPGTQQHESAPASPPAVLMSSINMSLKNVLTCYERIAYTASAHKPHLQTEMTTLAAIEAQGALKSGFAAKKLGGKLEEYSMDR